MRDSPSWMPLLPHSLVLVHADIFFLSLFVSVYYNPLLTDHRGVRTVLRYRFATIARAPLITSAPRPLMWIPSPNRWSAPVSRSRE